MKKINKKQIHICKGKLSNIYAGQASKIHEKAAFIYVYMYTYNIYLYITSLQERNRNFSDFSYSFLIGREGRTISF